MTGGERDGVLRIVDRVLGVARIELVDVDDHRARIRTRPRIGVVLRAQGERAVGYTVAVAGDDGAPVRNGGPGVRYRHGDTHRTGHLHLAAFAFGVGLVVGLLGRFARAGAGFLRALVGKFALVVDLVAHPAALVGVFGRGRGVFSARGTGFGRRGGGTDRARAEADGTARGQIARGGGDGIVERNRERNRDAHAGVAGLGVAGGAGTRRAGVRGLGAQASGEHGGLRRARGIVGEHPEGGAGVVVRAADRHPRGNRGLARRAALGDGAHVVLRGRSERDVARINEHRFVGDHRPGVGLADVQPDGRTYAYLARLALRGGGAHVVLREVLRAQRHIALVGDGECGVRRDLRHRLA